MKCSTKFVCWTRHWWYIDGNIDVDVCLGIDCRTKWHFAIFEWRFQIFSLTSGQAQEAHIAELTFSPSVAFLPEVLSHRLEERASDRNINSFWASLCPKIDKQMSGQTISDRLLAARHSIAGQGLAKSVCKATTEEVIGPKKKHLDCKKNK